jgi:glycerophosphodiester phosphodiesterase
VTIVAATPLPAALGPPLSLGFSPVVKIGHRGCGQNMWAHEFEENSIPGFLAAAQRGADFVEFDIQLASDATLVIYHDFTLAYDREHPELGRAVDVPNKGFCYAIKQFTAAQFAAWGLDNEWGIPLPTFADLLTGLPPALQFDVEVKYRSSRQWCDVIPYWERNILIDRTIAEIERLSPERRLFFSSFDTFVVIMLALKQKRFPVFQLTKREDYETIDDFVAKVVSTAPILEAVSVRGFVLSGPCVLQVEHVVKQIVGTGLLVFTYGDTNNTKHGVLRQLELGVSGICTDTLETLKGTLWEWRQCS